MENFQPMLINKEADFEKVNQFINAYNLSKLTTFKQDYNQVVVHGNEHLVLIIINTEGRKYAEKFPRNGNLFNQLAEYFEQVTDEELSDNNMKILKTDI